MRLHPSISAGKFVFLNCFLPVFAIFLICCSSVTDRSADDKKYPSPPGYDLNHPIKIDMPAMLDEISGIVYYAKDTSIFAESDASGSLYKIFPDRNMEVRKWKFGKNADYEDLQLVDSVFYVLSSKGNIAALKFYSMDSLTVNMYEFPQEGKYEFESLYYDKNSGLLNMICKACEGDKKKLLSVWSFDPVNHSYNAANSIDVTIIAQEMGEEKIKFKPSAAAINPLTGELFILSSVNKVLVVADKNGVAKNVYPLDPVLFKQPEGMAFTPAGDLLISNESHKVGSANILVFKNKKTEEPDHKLKRKAG